MNKFIFCAFSFFSAITFAGPSQLKIEEIDLSKVDPTLVFPMRSQSLREAKRPGFTAAELSTVTEADYNSRCAIETSAALGGSQFPIHYSDIPELDFPTNMMTSSVVKSTTCSTSTYISNASGFHQSEGQLTINLQKFQSGEDADRRLYHVTIPIASRGGWGTIENARQSFLQVCHRLKASVSQGETSVLYVHCVEPTIEVKCCGNVNLNSEVHALVFAYVSPQENEIINTGKTVLNVEAQNVKYLDDQATQEGSKLAFGFCTQPSFEYAPVMAMQSHCYTLKQAFMSAHPDLVRCKAETTIDGKPATVWASHKVYGAKHVLRLSVKSGGTFGYDLESDYKPSPTGGQLRTTDSVLLTVDGTQGTLEGAQVKVKGLPSKVVMDCK